MAEPRIYYSERLVQSWERSLTAAFSQPYVRLTRRASRQTGRFFLTLTPGDRSFRNPDDDFPQYVAEVRTPNVLGEMFWFAVKLNFDLWAVRSSGREHTLMHASIVLFQQLRQEEMVPIFRAEWDSRASADPASRHAQPHWHFVQPAAIYSKLSARESPFSPELVEPPTRSMRDVPTAIDRPGDLVDVSNFHFAMSPLWGSGPAPYHKQIFNTEVELGAWFGNLTTYIAEQLAYVSEKVGATPGQVRQFNPEQYMPIV